MNQVGHVTRTLDGEYAPAMKEHLTFAESVLRAHGATLPEGAPTSEQPAAHYFSGIWIHTHGKYWTTPVLSI